MCFVVCVCSFVTVCFCALCLSLLFECAVCVNGVLFPSSFLCVCLVVCAFLLLHVQGFVFLCVCVFGVFCVLLFDLLCVLFLACVLCLSLYVVCSLFRWFESCVGC